MEQNQPKKHSSNFVKYLLVGLVCFSLGLLVFWVGNSVYINTAKKSQLDTSLLYRVQKILQQKFDGELDPQKQSEGAVAGSVAALGDPYTTYLDEKANQELSNDLKGELSGIGVEVGQKNGKLTVIAPIDGTPAARAGIRSGDYIATIDGVDSRSLTVDEAVSKIRGEKGTKVKLTIVRGSEQPKEIEITRDLINVPSISYEMKPNSIGYIKIRRFGDDTSSLVRSAASTLKLQDARAVVVDVRDNPGGYLQASVDVASQFMSEGVVVEERSKHSKDRTISAQSGGLMTKIPVIILINNGSASASEILAGALKDNKRATLVGEKTYGKGSVQEVVCLNGISLFGSDCKGAALKVTVAHWYTPNGVNISQEGIKPDIEVKLTNEDYNAGRDPQLVKALELAAQAK
jgi:carboxyl-terminal processing protease